MNDDKLININLSDIHINEFICHMNDDGLFMNIELFLSITPYRNDNTIIKITIPTVEDLIKGVSSIIDKIYAAYTYSDYIHKYKITNSRHNQYFRMNIFSKINDNLHTHIKKYYKE